MGTFIELLPQLLSALAAIIGALGGGVWLRAKITSQFDKWADQSRFTYLRYVDDIMIGLAGKTWDTTGKWLKKASADGKIQQKEANELWSLVKEDAKSVLDLKNLAKYVADPEVYIESRIAPAIQASKAQGALTKGVLSGK